MMNENEGRAIEALFSGNYDHLTVGELKARFPALPRDDEPYLVCTSCERHSWSDVVGNHCGMEQPDGSRCKGIFLESPQPPPPLLRFGAFPWKPNPDARLVKEYHRYDIPLIGLLEHHDELWLFQCLRHDSGWLEQWLYFQVTATEVTELNNVLPGKDGRERFEELLKEFAAERLCLTATATEHEGIYAIGTHDDGLQLA